MFVVELELAYNGGAYWGTSLQKKSKDSLV